MADNTLDTLIIQVEGRDVSAVSTLDKVLSKLESIKDISQSRNFTTLTKRLDSLQSSINGIKTENLSKLTSLFSSLKDINKINISSSLPDRITELGKSVRSLEGTDFSKLNEMANGLSALSAVRDVNIPRINTTQQTGSGTSSAFSRTVDLPSRLVTDQSSEKINSYSSKLSEIKDKTNSAMNTTKSFGDAVKTAFSTSLIGKFASKITGVISSLGRVAIYRVIRFMLKQVTDAFSTGINDMYQYSLTITGSFSTSMDKAASSLLSFKNSLAAAISPLIEYLVPYLDKAVDKLMEINNTIAMVVAGLTGKSTYSKAVRVTTQYADAANTAADNTNKVKDSVDNLSRSFAGLDEITVIGDNLSDSVSSIADDISDSTTDYSTMFVETPVDMDTIDELKSKFEDILDIVKWIGIAIAAWNISKILSSLFNLSGLNSALTLAGVTLTLAGATLLFEGIKDVITDGMDWDTFWTLFFGSASLTAGTTILGKVISKITGNTNWTSIGSKIGLGISGAALIFSGIYDTIENTVDSGKGTIKSYLQDELSAALGGAAIGTVISPGLGTVIGAGVGAIVEDIVFIASNPETVKKGTAAIEKAWENGTLKADMKSWTQQSLVDSFDLTPETAGKIADITTNVMSFPISAFLSIKKWATDTWDSIKSAWQSVSDFFSGLWTKVNGFATESWTGITNVWTNCTTWFDTNIIKPVGNFFSGLWDGISKGAKDGWVIISAVWQTASSWFDKNVIKPVSDFHQRLWGDISQFAKNAREAISEAWNNVATWFDTNVIQPVSNFHKRLWGDISQFAKNAWKSISDTWNSVSAWFDTNVLQPVSKAFETVTQRIEGFFRGLWSGIKSAAASAINTGIGWIESAINGIISGVNWFIDKFNSIGEWAANVTGMTFYYVQTVQPVTLGRVPAYKEGGFPEDGLFYANHNELVGQFSNGKTAVANNEQIIEGIAGGVASANEEQNGLLREQNKLLRMLLNKDSSISVSTIASAFNRKNQRDGKVTVPVSI